MYHPTNRLLTILELLQTHPTLSGAELARRLEVEARSVRRYIQMLQDRGIDSRRAERSVSENGHNVLLLWGRAVSQKCAMRIAFEREKLLSFVGATSTCYWSNLSECWM